MSEDVAKNATTERETLLAVASPAEWWEWAADPVKWRAEHRGCLLCDAYSGNCYRCMEAGGHDKTAKECWGADHDGTKAIARITRAGIERG